MDLEKKPISLGIQFHQPQYRDHIIKNRRIKKRRLTVVSPESQLTYNIKVTPHVGYCLSVSIPPLRPRQLIGHHRGILE